MAVPKSAAINAASNSSKPPAVNLGEAVTMRLISWASLLVRFEQALFELLKQTHA